MENYLEKETGRSNSGDQKIIFGMNLRTLDIGLMKCGRAKWQEAEATRKDFIFYTDSSGQEILDLRALQGHSGRNPIDPTLQDNVLILDNFFEYISHFGCAVNSHSITNSGLIPGGQILSKERRTVFFTSVDPTVKEQAKPQRIEPAVYSPSIIPMNARNWVDFEPGNHSLSAYEVSKKVIHLLRHSQQVQREEDGAVHFWRMKENLQNPFPQSIHWSDNRWKACLAAGGGAKRRYQYCTDGSGIIVYLRALQGHSGRNLIDLSLQDNVVSQSEFFHYLPHWMCV